jgi:hypothetical protein
MPQWANEIIHYLPHYVAVLALYPACYNVFAWIEDGLSFNVKQVTTSWLKSAGASASHHTLSFNLLRFHCELFGDRQLSVKCVVRTAFFLLPSFLLVFFPIYYCAFDIYIYIYQKFHFIFKT